MAKCDLLTPIIKSREADQLGQLVSHSIEQGLIEAMEDLYFGIRERLPSSGEQLLELITVLLVSSVKVTEIMYPKDRLLRYLKFLSDSNDPETIISVLLKVFGIDHLPR